MRWLLVFAPLLLPIPALAQNVSVNGTISGGVLEMKGKATAPAVAGANRCKFYVDSANDAIMASCNGGAYTFVLGTASTSCVEDASGVLSCSGFIAADQNTLTPAALNRWLLFDNDVDLAPNPRCGDYGQAGLLTLLDSDEGATDTYSLCNGTAVADTLNATKRFSAIFGANAGGSYTPPNTDDDCACNLFTQDAAMAAVDFVWTNVAVLDAADTIKFAIYNYTGTRQFFEAAIAVTATGNVKTANALKVCVGGVNADTSCAADSECPASTCTTTAPPLPRGDYWACLGENVVTGLTQLAAGGGSLTQYGASYTSGSLCVAGDLPNTLAITPTWGTSVRPYFVLSDE